MSPVIYLNQAAICEHTALEYHKKNGKVSDLDERSQVKAENETLINRM